MGTGNLSGKPDEMLGGGGGVILAIDWHPSKRGGEGNDTLGRFYVKETGISSGMVCHLARELT